uniref:Uncharacterized protein n=1 Tax=Arundo donax TaxID=35708 RepID=A0A0A8ZHS6_ARUDO
MQQCQSSAREGDFTSESLMSINHVAMMKKNRNDEII